jgi:hypothetical protein
MIDMPDCLVARVGGSDRLGGGGANILVGFFDVFEKLKVQLIATVESASPGHLDRLLSPLASAVGDNDPVKIYERPGINLSIEGLGHTTERTILTGELPAETSIDNLPRPRGRSIMVNTVYSPLVALDALAWASYPESLGVLALTNSLCSKTEVDSEILNKIRSRHSKLISSEDQHLSSVHSFVRDIVLPRGKCTCIMNEDELGNFTELDFFEKKEKTKIPIIGKMITAIREFRKFQGDLRDRIYVTVGPYGSFVLNEENHLIYCGIYLDDRLSKGKTAIGDSYATFVLAIETIGNYIHRNAIPAHDVIRAAAAGADASVYYGFGDFRVPEVNLYLGQRERLLVDLGPIENIPLERLDIPIDEVQERDFLAVGNDLRHTDATSTLQEVIGKAFLKA